MGRDFIVVKMVPGKPAQRLIYYRQMYIKQMSIDGGSTWVDVGDDSRPDKSSSYDNSLDKLLVKLGVVMETTFAVVEDQVARRLFLKPSDRPPKIADALICLFLPKDQAIVLLGDLIEDYKPLRKNRGDFVANVWYWRQALSATRPALQRWVIKILSLCGFEEFVRHYLR